MAIVNYGKILTNLLKRFILNNEKFTIRVIYNPFIDPSSILFKSNLHKKVNHKSESKLKC